MSYEKAMKWNKRHPKGTKQNVLMHTDSGFTPSISWMKNDWFPYLEKCKKDGIIPMECEAYYKRNM